MPNRKDYDTLIIWSPSLLCNLNCFYCYYDENVKFSLTRQLGAKAKQKDLIGILRTLKHASSYPRKKNIDINRIVSTLDQTGRKFLICITGGEPFLIPNIMEMCTTLTRNHYIALITNLVTGNIKEFTEKIDPSRATTINASLHITEFEKRNLLDLYISNFHLCKNKGFGIFAFVVGHPSFLNKV